MLLEVSNDYAHVRVATDLERRWITGFLTFDDATAAFRHDRGARVRVYEDIARRFPRGFMHLVEKGAREEEIKLDVVDTRHRPAPLPLTFPGGVAWLRPYQLAAAEAALDAGQGIVWAPTGSGKTEIASGIVALRPVNWLFFVHRSQLAHDAADRFKLRTGLNAGRVAEGTWAVEPDELLTCVTYQSFHEALTNASHPHHALAVHLAANCGGFIADEGHTLAAETFWTCAMAMRAAYYRIAMSGTPLDRSDKRSIMVTAATGRVVYRIRPETLIDAGVLSKPIIRMVPCEQDSDATTHQGVYGELVVRSAARNHLLALMAKASARPALLFVREVAHGHEMVQRLGRAGVNAEFVWGSHSVDRRRLLIQRLVRGDLDVLVCSVVFQEGIDIPSLRSVIVGSGGQSTIAALQRIGRGMRVARGKDEFEVWDVLDQGHRWLKKHAAGRFKAYGREGYEVRSMTEDELTLRAAAAKRIRGATKSA